MPLFLPRLGLGAFQARKGLLVFVAIGGLGRQRAFSTKRPHRHCHLHDRENPAAWAGSPSREQVLGLLSRVEAESSFFPSIFASTDPDQRPGMLAAVSFCCTSPGAEVVPLLLHRTAHTISDTRVSDRSRRLFMDTHMATTLTNRDLLESQTWRYAVKQFDPARAISANDWATLEAALVLSPSSYGLQPYRFLVIDDVALRARLTTASYGQPQVATSARFVVFVIHANMSVAHIDRFLARTAQIRKVTVESLAGYRQVMVNDLINGPRHAWLDHWAARQAYIALGNLLISAATLGIDTCPMEGFDPKQYDQILNLSERGLNAVVACALGYRSAEDKHAHEPKVRFAAADLIEHR